MDQIFDRLNNLFKSFLNTDSSQDEAWTSRGDSDFDDAMDELNAFLNDDKEAQERLRRQQAYNQTAGGRTARPSGPPAKLVAACRVLGIQPQTSLLDAKKAWKSQVRLHHPDKHAADPQAYKKATEICASLNDAYRIVETWHQTGSVEGD